MSNLQPTRALGDAFVDHFAGTREHEWMLYSQTVSGKL